MHKSLVFHPRPGSRHFLPHRLHRLHCLHCLHCLLTPATKPPSSQTKQKPNTRLPLLPLLQRPSPLPLLPPPLLGPPPDTTANTARTWETGGKRNVCLNRCGRTRTLQWPPKQERYTTSSWTIANTIILFKDTSSPAATPNI